MNASAVSGSLSSALRVTTTSGSFGRCATTGGTSIGDGRYAMTASSRRCTPLSFSAVPQSTGLILPEMVARRIAFTSSTFSAVRSIIASRAACAASANSAGMSFSTTWRPRSPSK